MTERLEVLPIRGLPLLKRGDDLGRIIVAEAARRGVTIRSHDVIVVGQKAVSKAEGRIININDVRPSARASRISRKTGKRPEFVEIVLRDSSKVLRADKDAFIVRTRDGQTCLNGGVDKSNVEGESTYALLPLNPDASARKLMGGIRKLTGKTVGIVITDTRSRPFRRGQVEECIGIAGINPIVDYRGETDLFGYHLRFKNVGLADELASAAELVMGQGTEATPVAIIRGVKRVRFQPRASTKKLPVKQDEDLFKGTL